MGRTRRSWSLVVAAISLPLAPACGPDIVERAELEERCGQAGPVQLLALHDDPLAHFSQLEHADERRLFKVSYLDEGGEAAFGPPVDTVELWSVGECGESPRLVANDFDQLLSFPDVWPGARFECHRDVGEVSTLDPDGVRPPNVVFRLPDCEGHVTPHGIVTVEAHDEDLGALVLQPWPDDPWSEAATPLVLLDPIRIRANPSHTWPEHRDVTAMRDDEVLAITPDDALVSLSLPDGTPVVEAEGVREFQLSADGRWLVWQGTEITNDDEDWPAGPSPSWIEIPERARTSPTPCSPRRCSARSSSSIPV